MVGDTGLSKEDFFKVRGLEMYTETGKEALIVDSEDRIHPYLLPEIRGRFYFVVKRWLKLLFKDRETVFAVIDPKYRTVTKICMLLGFSIIGKNGNRFVYSLHRGDL